MSSELEEASSFSSLILSSTIFPLSYHLMFHNISVFYFCIQMSIQKNFLSCTTTSTLKYHHLIPMFKLFKTSALFYFGSSSLHIIGPWYVKQNFHIFVVHFCHFIVFSSSQAIPSFYMLQIFVVTQQSDLTIKFRKKVTYWRWLTPTQVENMGFTSDDNFPL